jgi:hypothetical protein
MNSTDANLPGQANLRFGKELGAAGDALTPLTGRDTEVSLLADRWEQSQEGMGQVVLLIGEAGLGKSRLVGTVKDLVIAETNGASGNLPGTSPIIE